MRHKSWIALVWLLSVVEHEVERARTKEDINAQGSSGKNGRG